MALFIRSPSMVRPLANSDTKVGNFSGEAAANPISALCGATLIARHEIIQEFGHWGDSGNQQVITGAGTSYVE